MSVAQKVIAAVPVRTFQATLVQLDKPFELPVAIPRDAHPGPRRRARRACMQEPRGRAVRRAGVHEPLSVHLPGAARVAGGRAARPAPLERRDGGAAVAIWIATASPSTLR